MAVEMKISVIIPSYKPKGYLWECLESLYNQTFPSNDFEILLVLNGCCEPYKSQIEEFLKGKDMCNVCLIQTNQLGVSNARNIGLDRAKGDYITFIDDDDYVSPSYLEELYEKALPDTISLCYPYAFNDGSPEIQLPYYIFLVSSVFFPMHNSIERHYLQFLLVNYQEFSLLHHLHRNVLNIMPSHILLQHFHYQSLSIVLQPCSPLHILYDYTYPTYLMLWLQ